MRRLVFCLIVVGIALLITPSARVAYCEEDKPYFTYGECDGKLYYSVLEDGKWYVVSLETKDSKPVKKWKAPGEVLQIVGYKGKAYYFCFDGPIKARGSTDFALSCEGKEIKLKHKLEGSRRLIPTFYMHKDKPLFEANRSVIWGDETIAEGYKSSLTCIPDKHFAFVVHRKLDGSYRIFLDNEEKYKHADWDRPGDGIFVEGEDVYYSGVKKDKLLIYKNGELAHTFDSPVAEVRVVCGEIACWGFVEDKDVLYYGGTTEEYSSIYHVTELDGKPYAVVRKLIDDDRDAELLVLKLKAGRRSKIARRIRPKHIVPSHGPCVFKTGESTYVVFGEYGPPDNYCVIESDSTRFWWIDSGKAVGWDCILNFIYHKGELLLYGENSKTDDIEIIRIKNEVAGRVERYKSIAGLEEFEVELTGIRVAAGEITYIADDGEKTVLFHGDKEIQLYPPPEAK